MSESKKPSKAEPHVAKIALGVVVLAVAIFAAVVLTACGATTATTAPVSAVAAQPTPSPTVTPPSRQVLAILRKDKAAIAIAKRNPDNDAGLRSIARIYTTAAAQLRDLTYPAAAADDAKALEADLSRLARDCSMLIGATDLTVIDAIAAQSVRDIATYTADRAALIHDLGLESSPGL